MIKLQGYMRGNIKFFYFSIITIKKKCDVDLKPLTLNEYLVNTHLVLVGLSTVFEKTKQSAEFWDFQG